MAADLVGITVKNDEINGHVVVVSSEKTGDDLHRYAQRQILGIAEYAGGDQREGHGFAAVFLCQLQAGPVALCQQGVLVPVTTVPHRADGMDHIATRQAIGVRDLGLAGLAAAQRFALLQQLRPRRTMDAAIHTAAAQQGLFRRVDNGIHGHGCYVVANDLKRHTNTVLPFAFPSMVS